MIKAIVGFKRKPNTEISPLVQKLMSYAKTFRGFSKVECMEMLPERSIIALVYEWNTLDDWKSWELSRIRKQIIESAQPLLLDKPHVTVFNEEQSFGWTYTPLKDETRTLSLA